MKARHLGISEHWLSTCAALLMAADRRTRRDVHERAETKEDDEHMQHPFTLEWSNAFPKAATMIMMELETRRKHGFPMTRQSDNY